MAFTMSRFASWTATIALSFGTLVTAQIPSGRAPTLVTVQGTVAYSRGQMLAGARVDIRVWGPAGEALADTVTDVDGRFALLAVPLAVGRYSIHASGIGFSPAEETFKVAPGPDLHLTFDLKLSPPVKTRAPGVPYTVVRVFYATDRQSATDNSGVHYLGIRSTNNSVSYGACDVSIPRTHTEGEVERPSIWRLEFHADPEKHMILQKVSPESKDAFFGQVSAAVSTSPSKEAFVFIHGYNIRFEDAAIRTAQLTYDFGFKGAPIFYSWPSKGSILGYLADEAAADQSIANFKQFLEDVADRSGATVVHVIAHSMGNRAALPALAQFAADPHASNYARLSSIVIAAPDVDRDFFLKLLPQFQKPQNKVTLYVSQNDQALAASHLLFHKQLRAGEGGSNSIVLSGLDTVDVSNLSPEDALGHSYYGDNSNVIRDILDFFKGQLAPRPDLSRIPRGSLAYWELLATAASPGN